jgi:hypothetical protein
MTIYKLAAQKETPSPEPAPLVAPWPAILGVGVGIPTVIGTLLGGTVGENPQVRAANAAFFGASAAALSIPATLLGMLNDYIITKASKKRTALQTILSYGLPHLAFATPIVSTLPLFLKQSSKNPPIEEPEPLATKWYNPILAGMGILTPVGALTGYALEGLSGAIAGSAAGALAGATVGMQGMVLDYLVTRIRGKRGPIQSAFLYSLPYALPILAAGGLGFMALQREY